MNELTPEQRRALFRVVRGEPDDAEVAALTTVLVAASRAPTADESAGRPLSSWVNRQAMLRQPLHPGPGAWRTSTWPR
ncbi:MAG: acyl-CoA carboxylase subunit epsilon [Pseudonocardia sp.]|nr:acyl-CoA carboxylase subunit epsilon [Pseudonocardia sp.]